MEGYNISTVLKRLEAATSRLEDLVIFNEQKTTQDTFSGSHDPISPRSQNPNSSVLVPPMSSQRGSETSPHGSVPNVSVTPAHGAHPPMPGHSSGPGAAATQPSGAQPSAGGAASAGLQALEQISQQQLASFVKLSADIAPGVGKQAQQFKTAFDAMLKFVQSALQSPKPDSMEKLVEALTPVNAEAAKIEEARDEFRSQRELTNFLATVPAGAGALGWVSIEGKNEAANFVQEMRDSALFYGNRALKDHKDAKPWLNAYMGALDQLKKAISEHFPEGIKWNSVAGAAPTPASTPAPTASGGAPPPPPPPSVSQLTANLDTSKPSAAPAAGGSLTGVFAELSQGESIASGLKPVDRKALKSSKPPVPKSSKPKSPAAAASVAAAGAPAPASTAAASKKKPRVELTESNWHVEDLDDRNDVEINATMGQSVQIDNCRNCTIKILGKAATFNMSRCHKVGLLVETMVASCDIVNSTNFGLQVTGTLPSLMIDQSGQGSIYLSEDSIGVDIFTSQTTTINVNIPEGEPGAYREVALGEQIVHNIVGDNVKSQVVKHA